VLSAALNREGAAFQVDVVLLDDADNYVGMIPVYRLAQLQSRLLVEHIDELQRQKERYRDLSENANDIIFTTDLNGRFQSLNKAGERASGYSQEQAAAMTILDVAAPECHDQIRRMTLQAHSHPHSTYEIDIRSRDGRSLTLEVSSRFVFKDDVRIVHSIARDITERRLSEARLRHNAHHDALTGLPNRALFFGRLETAIETAGKRDDYKFAVLLLDIDRFKTVNDTLGHITGDRLLVAFAERLRNCTRAGDTVARFGGDEFIILLDEIRNPSEAIDVADRILTAMAEPVSVDGHDIVSSASIGIAVNADGCKPGDLVRDADIAMYRAKFSGKARYQVFDVSMNRRDTNALGLPPA
jgi:diguanylate cyclase (GGDEF)-like protein/PAS domain S-box-containing protein